MCRCPDREDAGMAESGLLGLAHGAGRIRAASEQPEAWHPPSQCALGISNACQS